MKVKSSIKKTSNMIMMMITHTFIVIVTHSDIGDDYDVDVDAKSATLKDLSKSEKL